VATAGEGGARQAPAAGAPAAAGTRILLVREPTAPPETLGEYRARGGYDALRLALAGDPGRVLDAVERSGLRGRGGAAFPTARKWRLAAAAPAGEKHVVAKGGEHEAPAGENHVVANGGEHEPGSGKDRFLVERYPHAVLEGLLLCGFATGATRGWLYLIEDMQGPLASAARAIDELRAEGLLGQRILGTPFGFDVALHRAPTTYVAGEETAALNSIEGQPAKPRRKPPFPGEQGLFGRPTTVNNVETLAHVPWILRHGAAAYAAIGTAESKGTLLFTLGDEVRRPGVHELPFGATWRQLIDGCGGGLRSGRRVRAVLPAMSCAFLPAEHLDVPIAYETLRALGTSPGCGGVRIVDDATDVVALTLEIAEFFMREQCGQCPPCRMETNQFVHVLKAVRQRSGPGYAEKLQKLADFNRKKGLCSLIEMAAAPVLSAVRVFAADFAAAAGPGRPT
jgi:NADH-quinone oxidoreductase subunit F